jgi:hypothetical protein
LEKLNDNVAIDLVKELTLELAHCPPHMPVEVKIDRVVKASEKAGVPTYLVLKHFKFADNEVERYFNSLCQEQLNRITWGKRFSPINPN